MKKLLIVMFTLYPLKTFAESGVLILAHGSMQDHHLTTQTCHDSHPSHWEKAVLDAVLTQQSDLKFKTEVAFGMWNTPCFNEGIRRLNSKLNQKLDHLYVLPLFISSHSSVIEMQKFMFYQRPDRALPIPSVQPVDFFGRITYLNAIDYHPEISFILANRVHSLIHDAKNKGFSKNQMEVILTMHGPISDTDNAYWLKYGQQYLQDLSYLFPVFAYHQVSLRDDAPTHVREKATLEFRNLVSSASRNGRITLILPLLLSKGGIENGIIQRLENLDYVWKGEMLLPDSKLKNYIKERINTLK